mmetsp:Transcript_100201/g.261813  ORF Transcript_100201/g.261813 Transcript_100201/m.261813 type:complete len:220 (+) Transcript_100201:233-892(+)
MINSCEPFLFNFVATSRGVFLPEFFAALSAPRSNKAWTMSRLFSCTATCNGKLEPEHFLRGMLMPPLKPRASKKTSTFSWASVCAFWCASSSFLLLVSATCRATASAAAFCSAARSASSASSRRHCCSRILDCSSTRRCSWACRRQSSSSSCARRSASRRCRSCSWARSASASASNCSAGGGSSAGGCKGFPADSWSKDVFTFTVSVTGSEVPQALHAP